MADRFRTLDLHTAEEHLVLDGALRWVPVRRPLGIEAFGTNAYRADAGRDVVERHDERDEHGDPHQEMYVVVRGHARFTLDGEELDAPAGTVVFLPDPTVERYAQALEDGTLVLAVGGPPDAVFIPSEWEDRFLARAEGQDA